MISIDFLKEDKNEIFRELEEEPEMWFSLGLMVKAKLWAARALKSSQLRQCCLKR